MKNLFRILILAGALVATSTVRADIQTDTILNGGTNVVTSATTNTYRGTSANLIYNAARSTDVIFEFSATTTNANPLTAGATTTITLDAGLNSSQSDLWVTNALIFNVVNLGAANKVAVTLTNLPAAQRWPFYRVGEAWNTNLSGTNWTALKVRCFTKDGI